MHAKALPLGMKSIYALKLALIVMLSVSFLFANVRDSRACSCSPTSPQNAGNIFEVVFAGKAVDKRTFYSPQSASPISEAYGEYRYETVYTFLVKTVWKGPSYEIVYIRSRNDPSSTCGGGDPGDFAIGSQYLVYTGPAMTVHLCSRNLPLESAKEDLEALGVGQPPESGTIAPRPGSMDSWCSEGEVELARSNGIRLRSDTRGCVSVSASGSAAGDEQAGFPRWVLPTVAGVSGIYLGVLGTILTLRRWGGGERPQP